MDIKARKFFAAIADARRRKDELNRADPRVQLRRLIEKREWLKDNGYA